MWNNNWKKGIDYPTWGNNEVYKKTIGGSYLVGDETPADAYRRVATTRTIVVGRSMVSRPLHG